MDSRDKVFPLHKKVAGFTGNALKYFCPILGKKKQEILLFFLQYYLYLLYICPVDIIFCIYFTDPVFNHLFLHIKRSTGNFHKRLRFGNT